MKCLIHVKSSLLKVSILFYSSEKKNKNLNRTIKLNWINALFLHMIFYLKVFWKSWNDTSPGRYVDKTAEVGLGCLFFMMSRFLIKIFCGIWKSKVGFPKIKIDDVVTSFIRHVIYDNNVTSIWINNQVTLLWAMFFVLFSHSLCRMTISDLLLCQ